MELEVEEDGKAEQRHALHARRPLRRKEFEAELEPAGMIAHRRGNHEGPIEIRRIDGAERLRQCVQHRG